MCLLLLLLYFLNGAVGVLADDLKRSIRVTILDSFAAATQVGKEGVLPSLGGAFFRCLLLGKLRNPPVDALVFQKVIRVNRFAD